MIREFTIKNKIHNHLIKNGKKTISEKILAKTIKKLQKESKKNSKNIVNTTIFFSAPTFKIFTFTRKKRKKKTVREMPVFLLHKSGQFSFGIKLILKLIKQKNLISENFKNELLLGANYSNKALEIKNKLYETVLSKKYMLRYYKW